MIYPIVIYGSDVLRKPCERITPDYPEVKKLVEDMFLTLGEAEGVGLAAPQIGNNIRLFIVDWDKDYGIGHCRLHRVQLSPLKRNIARMGGSPHRVFQGILQVFI